MVKLTENPERLELSRKQKPTSPQTREVNRKAQSQRERNPSWVIKRSSPNWGSRVKKKENLSIKRNWGGRILCRETEWLTVYYGLVGWEEIERERERIISLFVMRKRVGLEKKGKKEKQWWNFVMVWLCLTYWNGRYGELSYSQKFVHHFVFCVLLFLCLINKFREFVISKSHANPIVAAPNCQHFVTFCYLSLLTSLTSLSLSLSPKHYYIPKYTVNLFIYLFIYI